MKQEELMVSMNSKYLFKQYWLKLFLLLLILPFLLLSFYSHPVYDDFGNAANTIKYGALGVQKYLYMGWTGRYFSSLVLTLGNPMSYGWISGIQFMPLAFLFIIAGILYIAYRQITSGTDFQRYSIWFALCTLIIYIHAMPSIFQGFFWFTGAAVYQTGNFLLLLIIVINYKILTTNNLNIKKVLTVLCLLLVIAAVSTNEVVLVQLVSTFGLFFLVSLYQRKRAWRWWLFVTIFAVLASLPTLIAPGNFVRLNALHAANAHSIVYSIPRSIFSAINLVTSPQIWIALLIITLGWLPYAHKISIKNNFEYVRMHPVFIILFIVASISLCYFPFWWISASYTPSRTENAIAFYLIIAYIIGLQATVNWFHRQNKNIVVLPNWLKYYVYPIFSLIILARMTSVPAYLELYNDARFYDGFMKKRYAYTIQQKKEGNLDLIVERLPAKKHSILIDDTDLGEKATTEPNRYYSRYFLIDSIRTKKNIQ